MESWRDWQEHNPYYAHNDWKPERSSDDDSDRDGKSGKGRDKSRGKEGNVNGDSDTRGMEYHDIEMKFFVFAPLSRAPNRSDELRCMR